MVYGRGRAKGWHLGEKRLDEDLDGKDCNPETPSGTARLFKAGFALDAIPGGLITHS